MDTKKLETYMLTHVRQVWARFVVLYPELSRFPQPAAKLNNRLKSTAGRCFFESNRLDFSTVLLSEFPKEFALDTIPHECAHQVAWNLFKDPGHGKAWKTVMRAYGIDPVRCHNYLDMRISRQEAAKNA